MSYSPPPQKMKNDMPKRHPEYSQYRERGGCLTVFLGWIMFTSIAGLVGVVSLSNEFRNIIDSQFTQTLNFILFFAFYLVSGCSSLQLVCGTGNDGAIVDF